MSVGLVAAEYRRLFSRRLFRVLALAMFVVVLVVGVIVFVQSSSDPNAGLAEARRQVAACQEHARAFERTKGRLPDEILNCPSVEGTRQQFDKRFKYAETMPDTLRGLGIAMLSLGFIIGASFIGAEWGSGSMTTLLTWEPRRGRLLAAKVLVAASVTAIAAFLFLAYVTLVFFPVGVFRGTTAGTTSSLWWTMSGIWVRGAAVATFGALIAASLATLFRNTAGAVGLGFFYTAILDPLIGALWKSRFRIWTFEHLMPRLLGLPVESGSSSSSGSGFSSGTSIGFQNFHFGVGRPLLLLTLYAAAALAMAYGVFRTRDVT